MQSLIERLWKEQGFTAILVTHDVSEAVQLADRIILLDKGQIAQSFQVNLPRPRKKVLLLLSLNNKYSMRFWQLKVAMSNESCLTEKYPIYEQ